MKTKAAPSLFFTELDAILDTRMGTLLRLDLNGIGRFIKAGYFSRDRDLFPGIDPKQFKELYQNRDKKTLQASMMTPLLSYIKDFCQQTYEGNIKTPFLKEPQVVVNLHPYRLTKEEEELLLNAIQYRIGRISKASFVNMTYEEITPNYLKKETSIIALYDPFEWLEHHSKTGRLKKESCPEVMMLGPLMLRNLETNDIDVKEFQSHMELMAKPFIDLHLMISKVFSANIDVMSHQGKTEETA